MSHYSQECNHGRSNETRDRLRKRLHQINSKSTAKILTHTKTIKNQPNVLKKIFASKPTATTSTAGSSAASTAAATSCQATEAPKTKPAGEQKDNSTNESLEAAQHDKGAAAKTCTRATADNPTTNIDPKNAKKRKILSENYKFGDSLDVCENVTCTSCNGKNKPRAEKSATVGVPVAAGARPKGSVSTYTIVQEQTANLDDILDFIEGNSTNKKDSQKKAAKKAKQKQKKEDVKRIEELDQLRDQFHEAFFKELDVKNDLKNVRSMKKRDKKKIAELETSIKKYGKFKSKIESNILELIGVLKANNQDFKFSYLPTKEQQLEKQQQQQAQNNPPVVAEVLGKDLRILFAFTV